MKLQHVAVMAAVAAVLVAGVVPAHSTVLSMDNEESVQLMADFLDEHADATEMESGVLYRVVQSATKPTAVSPELNTLCRLHYEGKLPDGRVFDSSYERGEPALFTPGNMIPGWKEVLPLMLEGDEWEVVIPSALAYGESGAGEKIPPSSALVFKIHLLEVDPQFEGLEAVSRAFQMHIPGLPFNISVWQAVLVVVYMGLRVFMRNRFARPAAPAARAPAAAAEAKKDK